MTIIDHKNIDIKKRESKLLVCVLVAIVAGFIFLCWLYLLPYILKNNKKFEEQKNNFQKVNEEAMDTLEEVKEIIKDMGNKIQELKQTTSTEAAEIPGQEADINLLKEKILEYKK